MFITLPKIVDEIFGNCQLASYLYSVERDYKHTKNKVMKYNIVFNTETKKFGYVTFGYKISLDSKLVLIQPEIKGISVVKSAIDIMNGQIELAKMGMH